MHIARTSCNGRHTLTRPLDVEKKAFSIYSADTILHVLHIGINEGPINRKSHLSPARDKNGGHIFVP